LPGAGGEVRPPDLDPHRGREQPLLDQPGRQGDRELPHLTRDDLLLEQILGVGHLLGDGLRLPRRDDRRVVQAAGQPPQVGTAPRSKPGAKEARIHVAQVTPGVDPPLGEDLRGVRADPPQPADGQGREEALHVLFVNDVDPTWLGCLRRQLGEELVPGEAHRTRQAGLGPDPPVEAVGRLLRRPVQALRPREVHERLVKGQGLDQGAVRGEDRPHLPSHLLVPREAGRHERGMGTQHTRFGDRHRGVHPKCPRLVRCRGDHAPRSKAAHDHRLAAQHRVVELLHGSEERVHVHVENPPRHGPIVAGFGARGGGRTVAPPRGHR